MERERRPYREKDAVKLPSSIPILLNVTIESVQHTNDREERMAFTYYLQATLTDSLRVFFSEESDFIFKRLLVPG